MIKKLLCIGIMVCVFTHADDQESTNRKELEELISSIDENFQDLHKSSGQQSIETWTKPLIIDSNNHDFDANNTFTFKDNIVYKPSAQYMYPQTYANYYNAAIIIARDNITIDLSGHFLSLDPKVMTSNIANNNQTYGIAILPGYKNIKIISSTPTTQKALIFGFSSYAIYSGYNSMTLNSINYTVYDLYTPMMQDLYSDLNKNITIDNLYITQNINGIYIANCFKPKITNCDVIYNYSSNILYGIYLINIITGLIDNCNVNQNYSYVDIYAMYVQDTIGFTIQNSNVSMNQSMKNGNASGIFLTASSPITSYGNEISNCTAHLNFCSFTTGKQSTGFYLANQTHHNKIQNCLADANSHSPIFLGSTAPTIPPYAVGFQVSNSNFNKIIENISQYNDTFGFIDTQPISSSIFLSNQGILNSIENFNITVQSASGGVPIPTFVMYPDNLSAYTGSGPILQNWEIKNY
ncbi:MAG: right-handed parallel beta-helix repeat-containing protein [Candidatus Chromulinivorax sp.]